MTWACKPLILDKGKPVARPGRKAKGRNRFVRSPGRCGSLAAEGMSVSARDGAGA